MRRERERERERESKRRRDREKEKEREEEFMEKSGILKNELLLAAAGKSASHAEKELSFKIEKRKSHNTNL